MSQAKLKSFNFSSPTNIAFGNGVVEKLEGYLKKLGTSKALIVTDKVMVEIGIVDKIKKYSGVETVIFDGVMAEPPVENGNDALKIFQDNGCDTVIGLGGGSPLDVAKAVALLVTNGGRYQDYLGIGNVPKRCAPLVLIPTTGGTGSEGSIFSIMLVDGLKAGVIDYNITAHLAVVDPLLTVTVPRKLTAETGLDAFCHCLETFINTNSNIMADTLSLKGIELITKWLPKAVGEPTDLEARYWVMFASMVAGFSSNTCEGGQANHALAFALGGIFHLPHGLANAVLLQHVLPVVGVTEYEKMRLMAEAMGESTEGLSGREVFQKVCDAVSNLVKVVGCDIPLSTFGVKESDLEALTQETLNQTRVMGHATYKPTAEEIKAIFRKAM